MTIRAHNQHAERILNYNAWANKTLLEDIHPLQDNDYFKQLNMPFQTTHRLLHHLYYYDAKYFSQITHSPTYPNKNESEFTRDHLASILIEQSQKWLDWIDQIIHASNSNFSDETFEMILDLSTHNTYHRGQLSFTTSFLGYKTQSLDIFFYNNALSNRRIAT